MIKIIVLCGADGTGKSTVKKMLEKRTNYEYIIFDRMCDSFVFKKLFNRELPTDIDILNFERQLDLIADVSLIYLTASTDILLKRIADRGEKVDANYRDFLDKSKKLFEEDYLEKTPLDNLTIDTTNMSLDEVVSEIYEFIEIKSEGGYQK